MSSAWPDHLVTLAEWDELSVNPAHRYELVEGVVLVVPRPAALHQRAMVRLAAELDRQLPADLCALADVEVVVDAGDPPTVRVPDVLVTRTHVAEANPRRVLAKDVLLAVEILSPGTRRTDQVMKAVEYADAGIQGSWILDVEPPISATAFTLVDGDYETAASGDGVLEVLTPMPLRIDLGSLTAR